MNPMHQRRSFGAIITAAVLLGLFAGLGIAGAQTADDALQLGFKTPPDSAKPRAWWHWTGGNVTKEGITKDLEWMKRVGIGGMQLADVASGSGQTIEKKLVFGSPQWLDAVHHAASEADRLGLEMSIFSSAGWSETGGPWVKPEQAMKKIVWSETNLTGPKTFNEKLQQPPSSNGVFGNLGAGRGGRGGEAPDEVFYGDSAVIAYRTPSDETSMADLKPKVTTSSGATDGSALMDDNLNTSMGIAAPAEGGAAWVQYEFAQPIKARAVTLVAPGRGIPFGRILASDDGTTFRPLVDLPGPTLYRAGIIRTYALPAETTAKFFRVEMTAAAADPAGVMNQGPTQPAGTYALSEFTVHTGARVNRWQEKAGFSFFYQYESTPTPPVPASSTIAREDIVDLTSKMAKDGTLNWDVPAGKWTVLRMGYSLTGAKNRPAPASGLGFEVDKLSRKYVEAYFHGYTDPIFKELGPLAGKSLRFVTMDSFEGGIQNWTDEMIAQFHKLRGYDPTPYLPVLAGRVVGSAESSDRFLWDFRRTIADLLAENHYGTMAEQLKQHGIGIYGEADGVSMELMEDTMLNKSKLEIPMGEFWVRALHPEMQYYVDVRGAASTSHAYGKTLVATESFTGGGYENPFTLKRISDYWFSQGVNRIVFHTSAQQPLDTKPGNTMVGTHINRNITWAEQAKPFMTYIARNSYMLQQGLFVADLAYLLDEGVPSSQPFWGAGLQPTPPQGYDYDCINDDVLLNRMTVGADGRLMLPDGMSYRVLVLPQIHRMTLPALRKIRELVAGGATVVGPRATKTPSLVGFPDADTELQSLAADVWGDLDGVMRNVRYYRKGRVIWGLPLRDVLYSLEIPRDFECTQNLDSPMTYIHRRAGDTDIYFLANGADHPQDIDARFRVTGRQAELWHSDTGASEPAAYSVVNGRTTVPLHLDQRESVFVVFRQPAANPSRTLPAASSTTLATIDGPWEVSFPANSGAPAQIELANLESWTANSDDGVKYFSGTATYTKSLQAPQSWFTPGAKIVLDLGTAKDLAEVSVNGQSLVTLWKPPYRVDVTAALKPGDNQLEIKVTNQWTNRILGDAMGPPEKRVLTSDAPGRGGGARGARGLGATTQGAAGGGFARGGGRAGAGRGGARGAIAPNAAGRGGDIQIAPAPSGVVAPGGSAFGGAQVLGESGLLGPVALISTTEQVAMALPSSAPAQVTDAPDAVIAGIPANYTEAKVGTYTLPDPLKMFDGRPVTDAKMWNEQRRPELLDYYAREIYGKVPATAPKVTWEVVSTDRNALNGTAVMKQLSGHMGAPDGPVFGVTLYTPANAAGPVPILLGINFNFAAGRGRARGATSGPTTAFAGRRGRGTSGPAGPLRGTPAELIANGFGYATVFHTSIETDTDGQPNINLARKLALAPGQTAPAADEWGTISAWAWGMSRVVDYLETDSAVDAKRIAIMGVSRLGKTVLWEGASDPRIALVIASCSGEGGAALARRNYGETIAHLVAPTRYPYQFAENYSKYAKDPATLAVDTHMLVSLLAPRPVLLQTGNSDRWSDPRGEFLAAVAATPVFKLLGQQGIDSDEMPYASQLAGHTLAYYMHEGGHGTIPSDWDVYLKFMKDHLQQ